MTPQEHYEYAEHLIDSAGGMHPEDRAPLLQEAQVHATLANFPTKSTEYSVDVKCSKGCFAGITPVRDALGREY